MAGDWVCAGLRALGKSLAWGCLAGALLLPLGAAAAANGLLERALTCKAEAKELPGLIRSLARARPDFRRRHRRLESPTADVYRLSRPVTIHGRQAHEVVVARMRILAVLPGTESADEIAMDLDLARTPDEHLLRRRVGPAASITVDAFSHPSLDRNRLLGCAYDDLSTIDWIADRPSGPVVSRDRPNPLKGWMD
ncbi:hypothetical protein [Aquabacterium humicola]|uniref:hypothetical protein n=1 Tax=Aquabacterium humicola TaxID=3237377 RepID=UPI0025434ABA|nr:hypothetical protein [Rubrivivax pictus]